METLIATIIVLLFLLAGVLVCALLIQGRAASKNDQANADRWHKFSSDTLKAALAINSMELDARRIDAQVDIETAGVKQPNRLPEPRGRSLSPEAASMMGIPQDLPLNGDAGMIVAKVDSTGNPNY